MHARTFGRAATNSFFGFCTAMLISCAFAAGPEPLTVTKSIAIPVAPAIVWDIVGNFGSLAWHPAVENTTADSGYAVGSRRTVSLNGGGTLVEELESRSNKDMSFSYKLVDVGPLPVSNYRSSIRVVPEGADACVVTWTGTFERGDASDTPAPEQNDESALKTITSVYVTGLEGLRKLAEQMKR